MARQKSLIKLKGQIGDLSFYKTQDGFLARQKGGVDGERVKNDPSFARTRENMEEFKQVASAVKLLRTGLRTRIASSSDGRVTSRLVRELSRVLKTDSVNQRGKRSVIAGDLSLLQGFEFNINGKLASTLYVLYATAFDRASGLLQVSLPGFTPADLIKAPEGATHAKLVASGIELSFDTQAFQINHAESDLLVLGPDPVGQIVLDTPVPAGSTQPLLLVLGVEFYQAVNGLNYPLKNGAFNALAIVRVERAV